MSDTRPKQLARSQMRAFVAAQVARQGGLCPLCAQPIKLSIKGEGVLDHDHDTGLIRGVLHRSCNAAEGKISNAAARWGAKASDYASIRRYLAQLLVYLSKEPLNVLYPFHKTAEQKREDRNAAARKARAAATARRKLANATN